MDGPVYMAQRLTMNCGNLELSALTAGVATSPALILAHGWPLSAAIWEPLIERLGERWFVLAFDLPGIGKSSKGDVPVIKTEIAKLLIEAAQMVGALNITFAGVDVGGMIAFSAARDHGQYVARSVIMNTVIPGVAPWSEILANPHIWHFAFHQIPTLPELLVKGHESAYFDYFVDTLAGAKEKISDEMRGDFVQAYADPRSLKTGFDLYRSMAQDAKLNCEPKQFDTPILYLRGDADHRSIEPYLEGFKAAGATNVKGRIIPNCGEIISLEQPEALIEALTDFVD